MNNYIRQQSMGEIVRNAFEIYIKNFRILVCIYFIPVVPVAVVLGFVEQFVDEGFFIQLSFGLDMLIILVVVPATTVAVSHICLGVKPDFITAYRRMISRAYGVMATYWLLVFLIITLLVLLVLLVDIPDLSADPDLGLSDFAGMLLLLFLVSALYLGALFTLQISVLEPLFGFKAIKRNILLWRGSFLRNVGTILVLLAVIFSSMVLLITPVAVAYPSIPVEIEASGLVETKASAPVKITALVVFHGLLTYFYVGIVLLYWNMRVRKEAYDSTVLAEELRG